MPTTLVTGATGFVGSHVARALVARGDDVRVTVRATSNLDALAGLDVRDGRRRPDRPAGGAAGAARTSSRVFHVAGSTNLRRRAPTRCSRPTWWPRGWCWRSACARSVERVVHTSSVAAVGPAPKGGTADERQLWRGGLGIPYVDAKHEAEVEALRIAARGLPVVVVCPAYVLGRGDLGRSSTELVRRFMLRRIPAYVEGAINVVDVEDVAAGMLLADAARRAGRALHPRQPQLHVGPPVRRPRAAVGDRGAGACGSRRRRRWRSPRRSARAPGPTPITPVEVRSAAQWWTYRSTKARRELGWTTRPHEETVEATVAWYREREGGRLARDRDAAAARLARGRVRGAAARRAGAVTARLHRCRTPTNWLCPCGRVARELARARDRVRDGAGRAGGRATATRSTTSPGSARCRCSSSGREVIVDSKRIVEHLRWAKRAEAARPRGVEVGAGREALVELEDDHAVGEREDRPRAVGVAARGGDHRRGGASPRRRA